MLLSDLHLLDPKSRQRDPEHQVAQPVVDLYLLVIGNGNGTVIGIGMLEIGIGNQSRLVRLSE
jgi:hypothetical protein